MTETLRLPDATPAETVGAFTYDGVQRLTAAQYTDGAAFAYGYDAVGNRLAATRTLTSTQTHSYAYDYSPRSAAERDDANRLVTADGVPYTWDDAGNLLADGVYTYSYDPEQRLVAVTGAGLDWRAGYTADGLRRWQATNGVTTTYILDLQPQLATVLQAGDPSGTTRYLYGLGDSPLASESGGVWRYLTGRDTLNSVRQETDAAGQVLAVRRFDPYGVPITGDGGQPYGYSGEWWDAETELVYLRARYLRPELGLFTSRDPWPGDVRQPGTLQGYGYVGGNPLRYTDPSGHFAWAPVAMAAGAIIGGGITYGGQVARNWQSQGPQKDLLAALTTDIDAGAVVHSAVQGALFGGTVAIAAPAVATLASESLIGTGLTLGIPGVVGVGAAVNGAATTIGEAIYGASLVRRIPTISIDAKKMPNIAKNIQEAQAEGAPAILRRHGNKALQVANRRSACAGFGGTGSPDEYPFASTMEGGSGAVVKGVPLHEQYTQGGVIGSFYTGQHLHPGDRFYVRVVGDWGP